MRSLDGAMRNTWPTVSVIIPMLNEERFIRRCLDSVLASDYPKSKIEILIVDGMSADNSRRIIQEYIGHNDFIHILENKKRVTAPGLNIGICKASGEIIMVMNAHTVYAPDYIRQCVLALESTDAANVGGVQRAVGMSFISSAIAITMNTPFGIGDARFRYSDQEEWVDSIFPGAWYKKTLLALEGFDEEWVINEDYELNYRLRKAGGKILMSPKIRCQYFVRSTLKTLLRQYVRYGFWKVKTLVAHPDSLRWRQLMPPIFVFTFAVSCLLLFIHWPLGIVIPAVYLVANVYSSIEAASMNSWRYLPVLPFVFFVLHVSYGVGFWGGLFRFGIPRFTLRTLVRAFKPHSTT